MGKVAGTVLAGPANGGFLAITPGDAADYSASTINWSPDTQSLANGTLAKIDGNRQIKVFLRRRRHDRLHHRRRRWSPRDSSILVAESVYQLLRDLGAQSRP